MQLQQSNVPLISSNAPHSSSKSSNPMNTFLYIILVIIIFILEYKYSDFLVDKSIDFIEYTSSIKENYPLLLQITKSLGSFYIISIFILFFFLNIPISKSYAFLSLIIYAWYFSSLLDIIYGPRRPNDDTNRKYFSNGGEKPSGHCLMATCAYIAMWDTFIDLYNEKKKSRGNKGIKTFCNKYMSYFFLIPVIIVLFLVMVSQVILEEHSFNMCLIGILYGLMLYFIMYMFFNVHMLSSEKFFKVFKKKSTSVIILFAYVLCIIVLFSLYYGFEREFSWFLPLNKAKKIQTKFNQNALITGMCICIVIGAHYGIGYLGKFIKENYPERENEVNNFNKVPFIQKIFISCTLILYSFSIALYFGISDETPFGVALVMTSIPCGMLGYTSFGMGIAACIQLGFANEKIAKVEKDIPMKMMVEEKIGTEDEDDEEEEEEDEDEEGDEENRSSSEGKYSERDSIKEENDTINVDYYNMSMSMLRKK